MTAWGHVWTDRKLKAKKSLTRGPAVEPSKGAFDDPTAWKHHESFRPIGALDDFSFELRQDLRQGLLKVWPLVATIGKELFQERVHPKRVARSRMPPSRSWISAG